MRKSPLLLPLIRNSPPPVHTVILAYPRRIHNLQNRCLSVFSNLRPPEAPLESQLSRLEREGDQILTLLDETRRAGSSRLVAPRAPFAEPFPPTKSAAGSKVYNFAESLGGLIYAGLLNILLHSCCTSVVSLFSAGRSLNLGPFVF